MIVQHFPAYNTPVLGYGTKIDVCFSTDTLSAYSLFLSRLPFGQKKKWCNGLGYIVISCYRVWQIPTSYEIFVNTSDGV